MANRNDYMLECTRDLQRRDLDLLSEEVIEPKLELPVSTNVLDLSCKNRTNSLSTNVTDTYPSLSSTTDDQYSEQSNISNGDRHNPYATVLMSPYSDTNSPKKRKLNDPTVAMNHDFPNNCSSNIVVPSAMMPLMYPPIHLLSGNEPVRDISKETLSMNLPLPTSFAQISQSLPLVEASRMIPQTFAPIKMLQSALSGEREVSTAQSETMKKLTRPFKVYPKDSVYFTDKDELEKYTRFRDDFVQSVKKTSENPNSKMRRTSKSPALPNSTVEEKDAAYWERRRKNNAAAKRSRDARRAKEDELAIKAVYFEQQNQVLKNEIQYLRRICMFYKIDTDLLRGKRS